MPVDDDRVKLRPLRECKPGQLFDFQSYTEAAQRYIYGTAADFIRDGYDNPQQWMHNVHAKPDDRGKAFLIGRGWSATAERRERIAASGIPVMAINDYPKGGPKPRYWCSGDPAGYYGNRIWDDIAVMKFAPISQIKAHRPREDAYEPMKFSVDAPNVHFFHHVNNLLEMESWLHTPYVAWGTSLFGPKTPNQFNDSGAARSSMLIGLRILWHLGYREVYLLGCDCTPHHHPAPNYWKVIFHLVDQLRPVFDRFFYNVWQLNPDSHLRSFKFADLDQVLAEEGK